MTHVELRNVTKKFGAVTAIEDLSFTIEKGSFVALLGPSGCGKSTLLRMIAGLEDVSDGTVLINGDDVTDVDPANRQIAMVFQSYALYPHLTVRKNIGFSLSIAGKSKPEIAQKTEAVANILQLADLLERKPAQLSGGQRQRVAIGRALVRNPEVFLFDEPLSNLDALLRVQMRIELGKLHRNLGTTMIYVTHDQVEAMTLADRIVVLDRGVISQIGTPLELYHKPANRFVASFIGAPAMNFLDAKLSRMKSGKTELILTDGSKIACPFLFAQETESNSPVELGIRPEHVSISKTVETRSQLKGDVLLVERLGNSSVVHLETACGALAVQCGGDFDITVGQSVSVTLESAKLHVFGRDGKVVNA